MSELTVEVGFNVAVTTCEWRRNPDDQRYIVAHFTIDEQDGKITLSSSNGDPKTIDSLFKQVEKTKRFRDGNLRVIEYTSTEKAFPPMLKAIRGKLDAILKKRADWKFVVSNWDDNHYELVEFKANSAKDIAQILCNIKYELSYPEYIYM
ncbi:MAG: hypothetical protein WA064_05115 [Candidatus Moraniibacteriota bacterium]